MAVINVIPKKNSLLDSVGEGGGVIWENGIETCISYEKVTANVILNGKKLKAFFF